MSSTMWTFLHHIQYDKTFEKESSVIQKNNSRLLPTIAGYLKDITGLLSCFTPPGLKMKGGSSLSRKAKDMNSGEKKSLTWENEA